MKILKSDILPNTYIGIIYFNRGKLSVDDILSLINPIKAVIAILSRRAVISENQILNAVYHFMDLIDFNKWIRNMGLRLLALIVGERQVDDALKIANLNDQKLILAAVSDDVNEIRRLVDILKKHNIRVYKVIRYAKPKEFSNIYSFEDDDVRNLELDILRKQAMLRIEIYRAF